MLKRKFLLKGQGCIKINFPIRCRRLKWVRKRLFGTHGVGKMRKLVVLTFISLLCLASYSSYADNNANTKPHKNAAAIAKKQHKHRHHVTANTKRTAVKQSNKASLASASQTTKSVPQTASVAPMPQTTESVPQAAENNTGNTPKKPDSLISADNLSGYLNLTSNDVWRGVSQSNNKPAVQGQIEYGYKGFYTNVWSSNVQYPGTTAGVEFDGSLGYRHTFPCAFGFDAGVIRYTYPSSHFIADDVEAPENFDYNEGYLLLSYKIFRASVYYSSDTFNLGGSGTYYNGGINWDIPEEYTLNMKGFNFTSTIGRFVFASDVPLHTYTDYYIGLSKALNKTYKIGVAWTDTNGQFNAYPLDKAHWIGSVTASF